MNAVLHEHEHMATTAAMKVNTVQTQRKGTLSLKEQCNSVHPTVQF